MRFGDILLLGALAAACAYDLYEMIAVDGDDLAAELRDWGRRHG
jgi:hypothetical protein